MRKITFFLFFLSHFAFGQIKDFFKEITEFAGRKKYQIGVSIIDLKNGHLLKYNDHIHFPMQSVYKFHLALAVLSEVDKGKLGLDQKIFIKKSDLTPDIWSPLREKYPNGNVELPLSEIIKYTVSQSDNVGCDILFGLIGGPQNVEDFIKNAGINDISIKNPEKEIQSDWSIQFNNWTTPSAASDLLKKFYEGKLLSKTSNDFLWKTMVETSTGPKKIKGNLPKDIVVAHKTGFSGTNKEGITAANHDIGIVKMPNGNDFVIVVFVSNSKENNETNEKIIADISKIAYDYFEKN